MLDRSNRPKSDWRVQIKLPLTMALGSHLDTTQQVSIIDTPGQRGSQVETVGIKQLKEHRGHYVARARAGETIVITTRGQEVAELVPLTPERRVLAALAERAAELHARLG